MNQSKSSKPTRLLSLLLTLCMVLTLVSGLSIPAYAAPGDSFADPLIVMNFAQLKAALEDGTTQYIRVNSIIQYSLNDSDISAGTAINLRYSKHLHITDGAVVDIYNAKLSGKAMNGLIYIGSAASLTITGGGTLTSSFATNGSMNAIIYNEGKLEVSDATLKIDLRMNNFGRAIVSTAKSNTIINSGTFIGSTAMPSATIDTSIEALYIEGNLTINGGTFYSTNKSALAKELYGLTIDNYKGRYASQSASISGGTFDGIRVNNGNTFTNPNNFNVSDFIADGYALYNTSNAVVPANTDTITQKVTVKTGPMDSASATITAPAAGQNPNYTAISGDPGKYTAAVYYWLDDGRVMSSSETFVNGRTYKVAVRFTPTSGNTFAASPTATVNGTSAPLEGVLDGKPWFSVSFTATVAVTVPQAPSIISDRPGDGMATIQWSVPVNGGSPITKYQVSSNGSTWTDVDAGTTTYTFMSLTNGTAYTLQVRAVNAVGNGPAGTRSGITPVAPPVLTPITDLTITGVTLPVAGATPVTAITNATQYTGTVFWLPALPGGVFGFETVYTAWIMISPEDDYTLDGAGTFTVAGATDVVRSGSIVAAKFPATGSDTGGVVPIDIFDIYVTPPVPGERPATEITETAQFTGMVEWNIPCITFDYEEDYIAYVTITPKDGYTLVGVPAFSFYMDDTLYPSVIDSYHYAADKGYVDISFANTGEDEDPPVLSDGSGTRIAEKGPDAARINFTTTEAGWVYIIDVAAGAAAPTFADAANAGTMMFELYFSGAVNNLPVELDMYATAAARDLYVFIADAMGNESAPLMIPLAAYDPGDVTPPTLSAGSVNRTSDTAATIGFTTDEEGMAYYIVLASGAGAPANTAVKAANYIGYVTSGANSAIPVTLTAGARDIYVVVEDAAGNLSTPLLIPAAAYVATTYSISVTTPAIASGGTHSFTGATAGYAAITPTTFTITNNGIGAGAMTNLDVALTTGTNFTLNKATLNTTLGVGSTTTFSIGPNTGLAAGTYTDTVTITDTNLGSSYTFTISFVVSKPALTGAPAITGTNAIGQALSAGNGTLNVTTNLSYQWQAGGVNIGTNSNTYTLTGAEAGKVITCIVTSADATGSQSATFDSGNTVPFNIVINSTGDVTGDTAVTPTTTTGRVGGPNITLNYVLGDGDTGGGAKATNELVFTGGTGLTAVIYGAAAANQTSQDYIVNAADATNGVITITAQFVHTDSETQTLTFAMGNQAKTFGDAGFTNVASSDKAITNAITYTSSDTGVVTVAADGTVAIVGAGTATITAEYADDGTFAYASASYTITVNKGSQGAPVGVTHANETAALANDGKIMGVSALMEWKANADVLYVTGTGADITGLAPGTYQVRLKETANLDAGTVQTVTIVAYSATTYLVTISGGGTGSSGGGSYAAGVTVNINAGTRSGYTFNGWTTSSAGVTFASAGSAATSFTMPANAVTVTANWTSTGGPGGGGSTTYYTVTFDLNGGTRTGGGALTQSIASGGSATAPTVTREGYTFDGWSGSLTNVTSNRTITAQWKPAGTTGPDKWVNPFADVKASDWFYGDVEYVYVNGLMTGTSTSPMLFSPQNNLTRAMIVTILYRLEGEPSVSGSSFSDVAAGQWYTNAVKWAADNNLVTGYGNGNFGPNDNITRQDLAVILMRYMNFKGIVLPVNAMYIFFSDETDIADYAMDAIQTFNKLGIINGTGTDADGRAIINPKGNATRAEAAAMLHRFLKAIGE